MHVKQHLLSCLVLFCSLSVAEPLVTTTSVWINPVFRSVLAESKSVRMAHQSSGPLSAVEFSPLSENYKIIESYRFHESREYTLVLNKIKPTKYGLAWTSPLGVSINLLSDQLYPIELKQLSHAITQALYDGVYGTRKKRILLIDKGILYWRGRMFPLQVNLDPYGADTDLVNIVGQKDLFGHPVRWATTWSSPTLNFYPLKWINNETLSRKPKPFLTLSRQPEYKMIWPAGPTLNESEQHVQRYYDRVAHLLEANEFDLLAEYIGHGNITILHSNWKEKFKSLRALKWRMKSIFTPKTIASILDQKDKPVQIDEHGIHFETGTVTLIPSSDSFEMIINP